MGELSASRPALVDVAEVLARELHRGQVDRQGQPYVEHLRRVAEAVEGDEAKVVAWLHDSFEDAGANEHDLRLVGIPHGLCCRIRALTRTHAGTYAHYIERLADTKDAVVIAVKLADLRDNMRPCPNAEHLHERYRRAIPVLEAALAEREKGGA